MLRHARIHDAAHSSKMFSCDHCGVTFGKKDALQQHTKIHVIPDNCEVDMAEGKYPEESWDKILEEAG